MNSFSVEINIKAEMRKIARVREKIEKIAEIVMKVLLLFGRAFWVPPVSSSLPMGKKL